MFISWGATEEEDNTMNERSTINVRQNIKPEDYKEGAGEQKRAEQRREDQSRSEQIRAEGKEWSSPVRALVQVKVPYVY